jgi:5-methylcytosine-specific restriction endonuclease McrA
MGRFCRRARRQSLVGQEPGQANPGAVSGGVWHDPAMSKTDTKVARETGPYWQNSKFGSRNRVANWLVEVVGEGAVFTKNQLREALPGIEQIDRRMRDLRPLGWVIRTYKDMTTLAADELFLERVGDRVWEPDYRPPRVSGISAATRRAVFERDGRKCMVCGVDFGSEYPDRPGSKARPTIGHWLPKERGGSNDASNLRAECHLCNESARNLTAQPIDPELLKRKVQELPRTEKQQLASWMLADRRTFSRAETLWTEYNQLPSAKRDEVRAFLSEML